MRPDLGHMPHRRHEGGVVLLEVLVAILIFSIGILAVIGMQASAIANVSDSQYRLNASNIATQQIGKMWVDQANLASYDGTSAVSALPEGSMTVAVTGTHVTVTVTWKPPNSVAAHTFTSVAYIYSS
jgi:type IV pilus assembly protein PilV